MNADTASLIAQARQVDSTDRWRWLVVALADALEAAEFERGNEAQAAVRMAQRARAAEAARDAAYQDAASAEHRAGLVFESERESWDRERAELKERLEQAEVDTERKVDFRLRTRLEVLVEAMQRVRQAQPNTLAWLRREGIVFDGPLGRDPKNWQHVAFSIYSDLCEVETIASAALAAIR